MPTNKEDLFVKVLMIGAHQDDNEFCCDGLAYKLVQKGHDVKFLSMCNGCRP